MTETFEHEWTSINTHFGDFDLHCFSWGPHEEDNLLCLVKAPLGDTPLIRIQSACYTAEIFRSKDCDCHAQLAKSLRAISAAGGILIYMLCDGRGAGLLKKVRGLALGQRLGLDTHDAYLQMGIDLDGRNYCRPAQILKYFGCREVRLLTNNLRKISGLEACGLSAERVGIEIPASDLSAPYLQTKALKMGHLLSEFSASAHRSNE